MQFGCRVLVENCKYNCKNISIFAVFLRKNYNFAFSIVSICKQYHNEIALIGRVKY